MRMVLQRAGGTRVRQSGDRRRFGDPIKVDPTGRPQPRLLLLYFCYTSSCCYRLGRCISRSAAIIIILPPLLPPPLLLISPVIAIITTTASPPRSPHHLLVVPSGVLRVRQGPNVPRIDAPVQPRHGIDRGRQAAISLEGHRTGDGRKEGKESRDPHFCWLWLVVSWFVDIGGDWFVAGRCCAPGVVDGWN